MKRKNMFTSAVIITLALSACLSGCGKQDVAPVMAATVEQQTLTYEVTTEEESVIATEEETESSQESVDENEYATATAEEAKENYTITEISKEMQATQNAIAYEEPNTDLAISALQKDEIVKVTGIVDGTDWYRIIGSDNIESFIDSKYLKEIDPPAQQQDQNNNQDDNNNNQQQQPKVETPKENPQPPVVNPPAPQPEEDKSGNYGGESGGIVDLPDGGMVQADGSIVYPGDTVMGGSGVIATGDHDSSNWW